MRNLLFSLAAGVLITLVFLPGLSGGFYLDDSGNLLENEAVQLRFSDEDFFSRAWHSSASNREDARPLAMLSFAVEFALAGEFDPYQMKVVNLCLHLFNALLVALLLGALTRELVRERALASVEINPGNLFGWSLLLAAIWALLPPNIGSTLYVVQRMNLLSAFFVLLGLFCYFHFRGAARSGLSRAGLFLGVAPCFLLGYWSKENALLGPLFILGFEAVAILRSNSVVHRKELLRAALVAAVLVGVLALLAAGALLFDEEFSRRPFDWYQRLALQPLALIYYVAGSFLPLVVVPRFYLDFMETTVVLNLGWQAWVSAAIMILILAASFWRIFWKGSLVVYVTLGWFFLFHLLESSVLPLEIAFQHRNYLPSVGLVAGMGLLALYAAQRLRPQLVVLIKTAGSIFILALLAGSSLESAKWGSPYTRLSTEVEAQPPSPRAHYQMGMWLYQNDPGGMFCEQAQAQFETVRKIANADISGYFGEMILAERCGNVLSTVFWSDLNLFLATSPFSTSNIKYLDLLTESCDESDVATCARLQAGIEAALNNRTITIIQQTGLVFLRAKLALYQGREMEAMQYAQEVLVLQPEYTNAHIMLLDVLYRARECTLLLNAIDILRGTQELLAIENKVGDLEDRFAACHQG